MTWFDYFKVIIPSVGGSATLLLVVAFCARSWIAEKLKGSISHDYAIKLERFKSEVAAENSLRFEDYKVRVNEVDRIKQERWEMKREVFLKALRVIDAWWSNMNWTGVQPDKEPMPDIQEIRAVYNQISLVCESRLVLEAFETCLKFENPEKPRVLSMDMIVDLRNAMRDELKFSEKIPANRTACWVAYLQKD